MQNLREEIESQWSRLLERHSFWDEWAATSPESYRVLSESLRVPGKRLRPMLFCLACQAFGRDPRPGLMPAAMALELVHHFILVHDDLLDRSEIRRGAPALFRRMDALLDGECGGFRGTDLALVSGDLLYTLAMDSLLRTQAPPERLAAAMEEFMRAALDTGRGALMEIRAAQLPMEDLDVQAVESMYAAKTGSYSFALPVRMAFGLCEGEGLFPFDRFGKHAGIAYQLKNDCDGLGQWLNGGRVPDDLRDRRRIWGVVHAWQAADEDGRALLAAEPGDSLREVFRRAGTVEAMGEAIRHHAGLALECVKDPAMKSFAASVLA